MIGIDHLRCFAREDNGHAEIGADDRWSVHCSGSFGFRA
jgi:hypothetical protein